MSAFGLLLMFAVASPPPAPAHRVAAFYADRYEGREMANGFRFRQAQLTCATNDWPLGAILLVHFGPRTVRVRVTDRTSTAYTGIRIDLSKTAFLQLHSRLTTGLLAVQITTLSTPEK